MVKKYNCKLCLYDTDVNCNYEKHLLSKKHIVRKNAVPIITKLSQKKPSISQKKPIKKNTCEYCGKNLSKSTHIVRHYKACKEKDKYELLLRERERTSSASKEALDTLLSQEQKQKTIDEKLKETELQLIKEKKEKLKFEEQTNKLLQENKELTNDYNAFLKLVAEKGLDKPTITNNNNICNIYYILNNCKDASNYDELMSNPLSVDEINSLQNNSAIVGPYELLNNRCIENIEFEKRSIHLVDQSRDKYCVKMDDDWQIDIHGDIIKNELEKLVIPVYLNRQDNISIDSMMTNNMKTKEFYNNRDKILNYANKDLLLKNNI
jgi:hypothetical protein